MRKQLKKIPLMLKIYSYFNYFRWQPQTKNINTILLKYAKENKNVVFIQIGAFDGITVDPIRKYILEYNWKGILVEPQKEAFNKLKHNYQGIKNLIFENVAVFSENCTKVLYKPDNNNATVIASFDPAHIKKHLINGNNSIITEEIQCITLSSLLEKNHVDSINVLLIDTEGYDFEILKQVDYKKNKPQVIIYEYEHLSFKDYKQSLHLLKQNGYKCYKDNLDIIAIQKNKQ